MHIISIILAFLVITIIISVHEFGHFIVAKKLGFGIKEYSVGFGKKIWGKKDKSGIDYSIRLLPLGGYVNITEDDFNTKSPWKQLLVAISGVLFNFIFAFVLCIFIVLVRGKGVIAGLSLFVELNGLMLQSLVQLFAGHTQDVGGVVSLISVSSTLISQGFVNTILLFIVINLNVAYFNLLPIPALDGARCISSVFKMITRKKVFKYENHINVVGFCLLIGLAVLLLGKDIYTIFIK